MQFFSPFSSSSILFYFFLKLGESESTFHRAIFKTTAAFIVIFNCPWTQIKTFDEAPLFWQDNGNPVFGTDSAPQKCNTLKKDKKTHWVSPARL